MVSRLTPLQGHSKEETRVARIDHSSGNRQVLCWSQLLEQDAFNFGPEVVCCQRWSVIHGSRNV